MSRRYRIVTARGTYVFGVDLEETRVHAGGRPTPIATLAQEYLDVLARHRATGTFFVIGEVARARPDLIRRIAAAGHEIACHSDRHVSLGRQTPAAFRDDLCRNLDALGAAGATDVRGYRAPCFSLTEQTRWAYSILAEHGFTWSSSVLPARNPVGGWPGFGTVPREIDGVLELPMTLLPWRALPVPMGGGVYFRALPHPLLRRAFRQRRGEAVLGYLHPYDIDTGDTSAHADFPRWSPYQWLMRANRGGVVERLETVARLGFRFVSYAEHTETLRSRVGEAA